MVWPLPDKLIKEFASQIEELYVVEELDPFIEDYVKALGIKVVGKDIIPICGELTPEIVDLALNKKEAVKAVPPYTGDQKAKSLSSPPAGELPLTSVQATRVLGVPLKTTSKRKRPLLETRTE